MSCNRLLRRRRVRWNAWIVLVIVLAAAPAWAGPKGPKPGGKHRGPQPIHEVLERHAERLEIDDDTARRIREIAEASREEDEAHRAELRGLHDRMRGLLEEEAPDLDAVMELATSIGRVENAAYKLRLRSMLEIRALLTPEQLAELVAIRAERDTKRQRGLDVECGSELAEFCPDARPGRETFECLRRHRDALSPHCRGATRPPPPRHRREHRPRF